MFWPKNGTIRKQIVRWQYLSWMNNDSYCSSKKYFNLVQCHQAVVRGQ